MPSIAVDTGPLVALFDRDDRYHAEARDFLGAPGLGLVTNLPVITEALFLLSFSTRAQIDLLTWAAGGLEIDLGTENDLPRIIEIIEKYADLPADFADASVVALCERRQLPSVATLDSDFDVYRTVQRRRLRNVFPKG